MVVDSLVFIGVALFLAMISPGANALNVISASVEGGRTQGLAVTVGIACGSFVWASLSVSGLAIIFSAHAYMLSVIKLFGGFYLLWLSYKAFSSAASHQGVVNLDALHARKLSFFGYAVRGFIVNMGNPKALLAWVSITAIGLKPNAPFWFSIVIILGAPLLAIIAYSLYAFVFSSRAMVGVYGRARRYIQGAFGLFFGWIGVKMLLSFKEV